MSEHWRQSTWGEEISLEYGKAIRGYDEIAAPIRVFGSNGPIGWTNTALAQGPGIILGRKGAYRGVHFSREPFFVIDTAYYVKPKSDLDMRWLYYAIIHHKLGEIDDGSPIPSTTRAAVYVEDVAIPPLPEQREIAAVLGALDDKIELNRKTAAVLEEMARALYRSWFVDFDPVWAKAEGRHPAHMDSATAALFPDRFDDAGVPLGWRKMKLRDVSSVISKGTTPKSGDLEDLDESDMVNFLKVNLMTDTREVKWTKLDKVARSVHDTILKRSRLCAGDVLFSIAGTIGRSSIMKSQYLPCNCNQAIAFIRPQDWIPSEFIWMAMNQEEVKEALLQGVVHAVQANLSLAKIGDAEIVVPQEKELRETFLAVGDLMALSSHKETENQTLATLRDSLLPRLISGELRVGAAREMLDEVA
ncbi:MAG: restriction endonuclease subunit S [Pseudomonadota bacterium]